MLKIKYFIVIMFVSVVFPMSIYAGVGLSKQEIFTQPNNTTFKGYRFGNENFNWIRVKNGDVVIKNPSTGYFEYAIFKKNGDSQTIELSGILVGEKIHSNSKHKYGSVKRSVLLKILKMKAEE